MPSVSGSTSQVAQMNKDTYEAEKRSRERIADAQKQAEVAVEDARQKTEHTKASLEAQRVKDISRQEEAAEYERSHGQEALEDLRLSLSDEARRLHREGEKRIRNLTEHFDTEQNKLETAAKDKEKALIRESAAKADYESKMGHNAADAAKQTYSAQLKHQQDEHTRQMGRMYATQGKEVETLKTRAKEALVGAEKNYLTQHEKVITEHQGQLDDLQHTTEKRLKDLQIGSAQRLNDYAERKADPFYKVVNMDASVFDMPHAYVVQAKVPEHEQDNVSISVTPGQVTLSGKRRASDQVDLGPGRKVTTAAYQSFSETFPINETVIAKELSKSFEGDTMTITIPKARGTQAYSPYKKRG